MNNNLTSVKMFSSCVIIFSTFQSYSSKIEIREELDSLGEILHKFGNLFLSLNISVDEAYENCKDNSYHIEPVVLTCPPTTTCQPFLSNIGESISELISKINCSPRK